MRSLLSLLLVGCLSTGCATVHGPRDIDNVPPNAPTVYDWIRVRQIEPPAEITLTTRLEGGSPRVFVAADDSRVVVLNLASSALTPSSSRVLRAMAVQHPEAFLSGAGSFVQDNVRIGRDGVFVADRKVAEFVDVVETIARDDVVAIDGPVVARGSVAGAALGGWLGFAVGVVPGLGGVDAGAAWPILVGSIAFGAYLGNRWSSHTADGVIYRAR